MANFIYLFHTNFAGLTIDCSSVAGDIMADIRFT